VEPGIRVKPVNGRLVLELPGKGNFSIVDLKGRSILSRKVDRVSESGAYSVRLPGNISPGLYLVQYSSGKTEKKQIITVVK